MQNLFFWPVRSQSRSSVRRAESFFLFDRSHSLRCRAHRFFWAVRSQPSKQCQGAMQNLFFLSSHSHAQVSGRAVFFGLPGRIRSAAGRVEIFSWHVRSLFTQLCQPVQLFLLGRLRAAMSVRAAKFSFVVRSHRRCAAKFFCCPVASAQQSARAEFFLPRSFFFCRPVSSAQNLLIFFVAHGISPIHLFRILRQKFELFGVFPLPFLAL
jgi:hypothetical protein